MANKNDLNEIYNLLGQLQGGQEAILKRMDKQDLKLESIEAQTIKTNGRVTKLEAKPTQEPFEKTFKTVVGRVVLVTGVVVSAFAVIGSAAKAFLEAVK